MTTAPVPDLVQRLRTSSAEERKAVAMELAQTGTNGVVSELMIIADGGHYTPAVYGRIHRYSLFRGCLEEEKWEYGLDDQLIAVEALGETGNPQALEYLNKLMESERNCPGYPAGRYLQCLNHNDVKGGIPIFYYAYPNARGALRSMLYYSPGCEGERGNGICGVGAKYVEDHEKVASVILKSIEKLERTVQNAPPTH